MFSEIIPAFSLVKRILGLQTIILLEFMYVIQED